MDEGSMNIAVNPSELLVLADLIGLNRLITLCELRIIKSVHGRPLKRTHVIFSLLACMGGGEEEREESRSEIGEERRKDERGSRSISAC